MPLQILGINHNTAPVAIRERVAILDNRLPHAYGSLQSVGGVRAGVIVSTCNRTELICETGFDQPRPLADWLARYHGLALPDIEKHAYHYRQSEAVRHILRVASGLDSMVVGEPQVLGQLKSAYQAARDCRSIGPDAGASLDRLFQHSFSVAKRVRSETPIGANAVSVASAAVALAKRIFADLSRQTALLIGAGETIELAGRHLCDNRIGRIVIANRSRARAERLARRFGALGVGLGDVGARLREADIVISSTASDAAVITKPQAEQALAGRRRPLLMVDLAVPRDIEPATQRLSDVYLYNIDDLRDMIDDNKNKRAAAADQAQAIIDTQVDKFTRWLRARDAVPTIRAIREGVDAARDEALAKALKQLGKGEAAADVIEQLSRNLSRKIIHRPLARLREAGATSDKDTIEAARDLFGLD